MTAIPWPQELHVTSRGSGPPLLMIMGLGGTHVSWGSALVAGLEQSFECISYDHRGVGFSPPAPGPFTIVDLAHDAARLLENLGLTDAHVFGVSLGGMVAQEFALAYPEKVRSLTLGCTTCGGPDAVPLPLQLNPQLVDDWSTGDPETAMRAAFEVNVSDEYASDPNNFQVFKEATVAVPARAQTMRWQAVAIDGHDTQARLSAITQPAVVVHGTDDRVVPRANGDLLARLIPGARLEILEGVGHAFWWERPADVVGLLESTIGT